MKKPVLGLSLFFLIVLFSVSTVQAGNGLKEYKKGLNLYHQGHYEEALELFQQAIDENLEFWQSFQMVGYCHFEMRQKEAAMKAFEESLDLNPNNPKLAKIYRDLQTGTLDIPVRPVANASTYYVTF